MPERQSVEALLIDPNPEDAPLFLDALENEKIANHVHTVSDGAEAVADSYDLHANAYVRKPVDPDAFLEIADDLENFWLEIVWLPPSDGDGPVGSPER